MRFFVTGVNGQLGHDVMNELKKRGYEAVGSDIQDYCNAELPYISFLISAWELIHFKWDGKRFLISGRSVHEVINILLTEIQDHTELDRNVVKL